MDPAIKFGYYRGVGWYARIINIPVEWEKNVFLYVLKQQVKLPVCMLMADAGGTSRGLYRFLLRTNPYIIIGKANELRVEVDNIQRQDIPLCLVI